MQRNKQGASNIDDLAELTEPFTDEGLRGMFQQFFGLGLPDLAAEIPIAKTIIVIGKVFNNAKDFHRTQMLRGFLDGLKRGSKRLSDYEKLSEENKLKLRSLVISQLDMQSDVRQAEAIGLIVNAYIEKKIDWIIMTGLISEIKNINPLLLYFNVDSIKVTKRPVYREAYGATYLLPRAFGQNTIVDIGQYDSTGENKFILTQLGVSFFDYVYDPLFGKYYIPEND